MQDHGKEVKRLVRVQGSTRQEVRLMEDGCVIQTYEHVIEAHWTEAHGRPRDAGTERRFRAMGYDENGDLL